MLKLLTLLLFSSCLYGQDNCSFFAIPQGSTCLNVWPTDTVTGRFCEWKVNEDGSTTAISGDPTIFNSTVLTGSGYHVHDLGPGINPYTRPRIVPDPDHGTTDSAGCISTLLKIPGFAGTYKVQALASYQSTLTMAAAWAPPSPFVYAKPLTPNLYMLSFNNVPDGYHNLQSFWVRSDREAKFRNIAFYFGSEAQTPILYTRCGLPEGGISDNDWGAPNDIGKWALGTRKRELHQFMDECDVYNPSMVSGEYPNVVKVNILREAAERANCSFGKYTANSDTQLAEGNYWASSQFIHLTCDKAPIIPLPIPIGPPQ